MNVRHGLRNALVLVAVALTAPLWIPVRFFARLDPKDNLLLACSQFLSLFPGLVGIFLRRGFYFMSLESFSPDCTIEFGTWLSHRHLRIGRSVYVGGRCILGMCEIGDYALIGSNVDILTGRHQHRFDDASKPICEQGGEYQPIRIGCNTWIGNSSVVMADVGDGAIIGAGSVVVKPIPPACIAVGNPCAVKKSRSLDNTPEKSPEHVG